MQVFTFKFWFIFLEKTLKLFAFKLKKNLTKTNVHVGYLQAGLLKHTRVQTMYIVHFKLIVKPDNTSAVMPVSDM